MLEGVRCEIDRWVEVSSYQEDVEDDVWSRSKLRNLESAKVQIDAQREGA
jgi:hypothetical protein